MLLFDQNLSPSLVRLLANEFPDSIHVRNVGMRTADDPVLWSYAVQRGMMIVSKDADFQQRAMLYGHPPKVIWVRLGNCPTRSVAARLKSQQNDINHFTNDLNASLFIIS